MVRAPTRACQSSGSAGSELDISCIIRGARWHSIRTLPLPLLKELMLKLPLQGSEKSDVNNQSLVDEQDRRSRRNKTQRRSKSLHPCSQRRRLHVLAVAVTTCACSCEIASANRINVSCLISQRLVNDAFRYRA